MPEASTAAQWRTVHPEQLAELLALKDETQLRDIVTSLLQY